MTTMTFFEIGGEVVEVLTSDELREFTTDVALPVAEMLLETSEAFTRKNIDVEKKPEKDSLFEHWLKTGSYNARHMTPSLARVLTGRKHPMMFAAEGVGNTLTVIEMHYDYFVKGESRPWDYSFF